LLADEPTGSVDDEVAMRILYLFEELNKMGTTVLVATHNDKLVSRFAHPRLELQDGETSLLPPVRGS
jgi:cell division transport system ATP-binding protein